VLLHQLSPRASAAFIDLNCAGLSRELLESELFGHEKGAFTGAHSQKQGLLEVGAGGSIFLDEIGEMDLSIQARLLKALDEKRFRRVGGVRDIRVDVRIIAATNRDLQKEIAEKRFRSDLFFRLNVVGITLPPLRQRPEDIPVLVGFLVDRLCRELGKRPIGVSPRAMKILAAYRWPGNVRELRNVLERAVLLTDRREIQGQELHIEHGRDDLPEGGGIAVPRSESEIRTLAEIIQIYAGWAVEATSGNMRNTARRLGISPSTLYSKLRKGDEPF
jgi:DNA-binding NtrC family response regulator